MALYYGSGNLCLDCTDFRVDSFLAVKKMEGVGGGINEHGVDKDIGARYAGSHVGVKNGDTIGGGAVIFCVGVYTNINKT